MYKRFLNNDDYLGIITEEAMSQLIRGKQERVAQAEEAAEASIVEYLTDNYEIERELAVGKNLLEYRNYISYPVGAHFYRDGKIYEAIRSINGTKAPTSTVYWNELLEYNEAKFALARPYRQIENYKPGDIVVFSGVHFECCEYNGFDYNDIRIPGVNAWEEVEAFEWIPNFEYVIWDVVQWEDNFFALLSTEDIDLTLNPMESENWGLIGEYDPEYQYSMEETEFVRYNGKLYVPTMSPNADKLEEGYNIRLHDPRNANIKKHLIRLALYELYKLISPNNVSSARITDYEASITWLRDANRCKINPQIPRKLDEEHKPVSEIAIATFQRDYDPYKNPWQI